MGGRERSETESLEAPPDRRRQTYQDVSDTLPPVIKKRRWPGEGPQPDQYCVAKWAPVHFSKRGRPISRKAPACLRRQPEVQDRHVRRRSYRINTGASASRGADEDQQHGKRDGSPDSTTTSTTTSLSCTDDSTTASECNNEAFMPQPRPAPLSQDEPTQRRYAQQAQPNIISVWPLACELAYRHLQSIIIGNDPVRATVPTTSDPDPTPCLDSTGGDFPLLRLLQEPSGLCIPDVVNPTQAAAWLQSATAFLSVSETDAVLA